MDKKALVGIGIIAVGGFIAVTMLGSNTNSATPGSGGGGVPPPATKKEEAAPNFVYNINFPEPNFPSIPSLPNISKKAVHATNVSHGTRAPYAEKSKPVSEFYNKLGFGTDSSGHLVNVGLLPGFKNGGR